MQILIVNFELKSINSEIVSFNLTNMSSQVEHLSKRKSSRIKNKTHLREIVLNSQEPCDQTLDKLSPTYRYQNRPRTQTIQSPTSKQTINSPKYSSTSKFKFEESEHSLKPEVKVSSTLPVQSKKEKVNPPPSRAQRSVQSSTALDQIVKQVKSTAVTGEVAYKEHLFQTFQAMKFIKTLKPIDNVQLRDKTVILPRRRGYENAKTVIFDLDETLVHCCENPLEADVPLTISFPTGEKLKAGINIRPYARECLLAASQVFEVIVFTASQKCYADEALDYLDPTNEIIHHRLYRDSCVVSDGVYIKDLRIFGNRRLKDLLIIDNSAYSFAYQLDNGIPIISWYSDCSDKELFNLVDYLKVISRSTDVRTINRQTFHLETFYDDYMHDFIMIENQ